MDIDNLMDRFAERNKDKPAAKDFPTRYSVVVHMDVLARSDEEAEDVVDTIGKHLNCFDNISNAKAEFV